MMKYKMNKKGVVWIPIILVGTFLVTFFTPQLLTYITGRNTALKVSSMLNTLPIWFWVLLIFLLFIILIRRKK